MNLCNKISLNTSAFFQYNKEIRIYTPGNFQYTRKCFFVKQGIMRIHPKRFRSLDCIARSWVSGHSQHCRISKWCCRKHTLWTFRNKAPSILAQEVGTTAIYSNRWNDCHLIHHIKQWPFLCLSQRRFNEMYTLTFLEARGISLHVSVSENMHVVIGKRSSRK